MPGRGRGKMTDRSEEQKHAAGDGKNRPAFMTVSDNIRVMAADRLYKKCVFIPLG